MFDISKNLSNVPDKPGVYIHKDDQGTILYIGKAVSLKRRLRQYFQSTAGMDRKIQSLVEKISEFEYIVTNSEIEALILESLLIKKYLPKYNTLLRDDKTFPWIKLTSSEEYPRLVKTRRKNEKKDEYFGPYTDVLSLKILINMLSDAYQLKRCPKRKFSENHKPCLNYHIGKCRGVCINDTDSGDYLYGIEQIRRFLNGETKEVLIRLEKMMNEASESLDFERAAEIRNQINAVNAMPDQAKLDKFLSNVRRNKIKVVRKNYEELQRKASENRKAIVAGLESLGITSFSRIESYDISHIAGSDAVGSMVVYNDFKKEKKSYRRFRIKTASGGGDTDSLEEVLTRRLRKGLESDSSFLPMPDLILLDGGTAQVNAVKNVLSSFGISIKTAGMVKNTRHRTRGLIINNKEYNLKSHPELFRFIAGVQEETHRFAIEYHKKIRSRKMRYSIIDEVPGIGEKRKRALFEKYKTVKAMREATVEELAETESMNQKAAMELKKYLEEEHEQL